MIVIKKENLIYADYIKKMAEIRIPALRGRTSLTLKQILGKEIYETISPTDMLLLGHEFAYMTRQGLTPFIETTKNAQNALRYELK